MIVIYIVHFEVSSFKIFTIKKIIFEDMMFLPDLHIIHTETL